MNRWNPTICEHGVMVSKCRPCRLAQQAKYYKNGGSTWRRRKAAGLCIRCGVKFKRNKKLTRKEDHKMMLVPCPRCTTLMSGGQVVCDVCTLVARWVAHNEPRYGLLDGLIDREWIAARDRRCRLETDAGKAVQNVMHETDAR